MRKSGTDIKRDGLEKLCHPFPPLYDENSKILILGSFPSVKSREMEFLRASAEPLLEAFESAAGCSVSGDGAGEKGFSALSQNRGMGCDRLL